MAATGVSTASTASTPSSSTHTLSTLPVEERDSPVPPSSVPVQDVSPQDSLDEAPKKPAEKAEEPKSAEDVAWDEDPANPRNWTTFRKWKSVGIVSLYTFVS